MSQANNVECPICGLSFPVHSVNEHVNKCLTANSKESASRAASADQVLCSKTGRECSDNSLSSSLDKDADLCGKKLGIKEKKLLASPPSGALKRSFNYFNRANLAGKSNSNSFFKRPKVDEGNGSTNSESTTKYTSDRSLSSDTKETVSVKSPSASFTGKVIGKKSKSTHFMPLAERMRPKTLEKYVGQSKVLGSNSLLRTLLEAEEIPSMIFWGPPGCGKTTLAHIIANSAGRSNKARFVPLSATTSGINDVKEVVKVAKNEQQLFKRKTILFVDEIHRFNKLQQDTFLPHVENGTITLIGATTENPSFQLNNALLSRCRVIVLEKLTTDHVEQILRNAVDSMGLSTSMESLPGKRIKDPLTTEYSDCHVVIEDDAIKALANLCDGDARIALNGLQVAIQSQVASAKLAKRDNNNLLASKACLEQNGKHLEDRKLPINDQDSNEKITVSISVAHVKEGLQKNHLLYDRNGEEHYNIISAMHKSIRGSDENAALYWLARMLVGGEDPLYVARRLVRCASEDIGLADPHALNQAVAAYQACHFIGMPECDVILAQAAVYLARAPKSIKVYNAYSEAKKLVREWEGPQPAVPLHIRNAPTKLMKSLGYGAGYKYNPAFNEPVDQDYLPPELQGVDFFSWGKDKTVQHQSKNES
ncbi:ATPase WRNIP1-like isoform X1 [Acropora millepora]|uniref:ATPase WRNIP1-like isoform X1 n=1 Tax=Acropora millepora TaxID=45264 RepID=UPI001CF2D967|nr:ATPase WRNIP1-like isoform X1 [Acropora millepora]